MRDKPRRKLAPALEFRELKQRVAAPLLLPMLLLALIPVGMMPELNDDGRLTIVICSTDGMREIIVDRNGNPVEEDEQSLASPPCVFSGLAFAAILPAETPPFYQAQVSRPPKQVPSPTVLAGRALLPVGARAPPAV